jgi:hypothetical protein
VRVFGGFVQEDILNDDAFHFFQRAGHVLCIRIGLNNIFAFTIQAHEGAFHCGSEHVRNTQAWFRIQYAIPCCFEFRTRDSVRNMTIAWQFVRERTHIAGTLHVVLTAQWIDAHTFAADVAGGHREVGDTNHGGRTLCMFRHAQTVVDGTVFGVGIHTRCGTDVFSRYAAELFPPLQASFLPEG